MPRVTTTRPPQWQTAHAQHPPSWTNPDDHPHTGDHSGDVCQSQ